MELLELILCFCSGACAVDITGVTSRTEIPDSCNLTAPSLSIDGTVVNPSLNTTFDSQNPTPSGVWVNYTNDYVYLQIMGCIDMKDANVTNTSFQDPLNCPFVCKVTEYIGFTREAKRTECLCLTFHRPSINTTQAMCGNACANDELLCGAPGFAAIYRQVTERSLIAHLATSQEIASEKENCLSTRGGTLEWRDCETPVLDTACMLNCTNGKPFVPIHNSLFPWWKAVAHCLRNNRCPVRLSKYLIRNLNNDLDWWVGVIRVRTKTRQYGYLNKDGDTFYLDFTSNASQFQWALCNGLILDTLHISTQYSAESITSTVNNSGIGDFPDPTPGGSKETINNNHSVGMYIGISVAVVVLIITVTGGFCFWRRRNSPRMKDNGKENQSPSGSIAMTNKAYSCGNETFAHIKAGNTGHAKLHETPPDITETTNDPHYFTLERKSDLDSPSTRSSTVKPDDSVHYNCIEEPEHYSRVIENEIEDVNDNYHTIPHSSSKSHQPISLSDNYDRIHPMANCETSNSYGTDMYSNATNGNNSENPKPITGQCDDYDRLCLRDNSYDKLGMNCNALDTSTYSTPHVKTTVQSDYDRINKLKSSGIDNTYDHIGRHDAGFNKNNSHTDDETPCDNNATGYDTVSNIRKTSNSVDSGLYSHVSSE